MLDSPTLSAKSIVHMGLVASLVLPPSMLSHPQLSRSNAVNTASLTTVVDNLYRQNFLTETTYQEVRRLTELGEVQSRSRLLRHVIEDLAYRLWGARSGGVLIYGSMNTPTGVVIPLEMPATELQQLLQRLNDTGVLSPSVYHQLQEELAAGRVKLDVALFQQAETRMQEYERLQPEAIAPYLQKLNALGILSDENLTRLLQDLSTGWIESKTDLVNYFDRALLIQSAPSRGVIMTAQSKSDELRSFASAVWVVGIRLGSSVVESTTMAAICETEQASTIPPEMVLPTDITQTSISCPPGSRRVDLIS